MHAWPVTRPNAAPDKVAPLAAHTATGAAGHGTSRQGQALLPIIELCSGRTSTVYSLINRIDASPGH